jgi:hypothetical protein
MLSYLRCDAQLCLLLTVSQIADAERSNHQSIHRSFSSLGFGLGHFSTQEFHSHPLQVLRPH